MNNSIVVSQLIDLPQEIILLISSVLDVKSLLLFSKTTKELHEFYSIELLMLLKVKLRNLTKLNTDTYDLDHLYNIYRLMAAGMSYGGAHFLLLNSKGTGFYFLGNYHSETPFDILKIKPLIIPHVNNISKVLVTINDSFLIDCGGNVYIIKFRDDIQLESRNVKMLSLDPNMGKVKSISCSYYTTFMISESGHVYICYDTSTCYHLKDIINAIDVHVSYSYLFILTADNTLHYYVNPGSNVKLYNQPWNKIHFKHKDHIIKMSANETGLAFLRSDGRVLWLGPPFNMELKVFDNIFNIIDISASVNHVFALDNNGKVYFCANSDTNLSPIVIPSLSNIIKISAGLDNILALDYNGNLHTFNDDSMFPFNNNNPRQLGICEIIPNINLL